MAFLKPVYANISLNNSNVTGQKGTIITKNTEKSRTNIKLAGTRWILDNDKDQDSLVFTQDNLFPKNTANCKSVKNGINGRFSYVQKCSSCEDGYELDENEQCVEKKCENYNSSTADIAGCETVDFCQKGKQFMYKCEECFTGYRLTNEYLCEIDECENYPYDKREDVSHCKEEPLSCNKGQSVYYGCPQNKCETGFKWKKGLCDVVTCSADFALDSCPPNGICNHCQSGSYKKYKLNSCRSGYMVSSDSCVKTSGALVFTIETTQNNQKIALSAQGEYTIDWGDGAIENYGISENTVSDVSHAYSEPGSYNVRITGEPTNISIKSGQEYITNILETSLLTIDNYEDIFPTN